MAVVTLAQAKAFLNITDSASDAELPFYVSAAESMWAKRGGPVGSAAYDEWYDGGSDTISVRTTPVISVTAVTESFGSATYTLVDTATGTSGYAWAYTVDKATGTFVRRAAGVAVRFMSGERNVHITYTAGYASVPEDVQLAVLLLIKHMWTTQRGLGVRPGTGGEEYQPKEGYTFPNRVEEILAGYKVPGDRMTVGSVIPVAIDKLIALLAGNTFAVLDGAGATDAKLMSAVFIGWSNPDETGIDEAASTDQRWAWLGHQVRDETAQIRCVARSWNGNGNLKQARDEVFAIVGVVGGLIQTDPSLGLKDVPITGVNTFQVMGISSSTFRQSLDNQGAMAELPFDIEVRGRVS